jgi:hypothetical protein
MPHTGDKRLLERPIIGPFGEGSIDVRVVEFRLAISIFQHGQARAWPPRIEHPQDEVQDAMIANFALWTPLGHREVWEDTCGELGYGRASLEEC